MILWFLGAVLTSVIITIGLVYCGLLWYNKRLEAQVKEANQEFNRVLKEQINQEKNANNIRFTHEGTKGFLQ